jgi:hypothetical protein
MAAAAAIANVALHAFLKPVERDLSRGLNMAAPNNFPPAEAAIEAFYRGWLDLEQCKNVLLWNGISFDPHLLTPGAGAEVGAAWQHIFNSQRPVVPLEIFSAWYAQGRLGSTQVDDVLKHAGLWQPHSRTLWKSRVDLPGLDSLIQQFRLGVIDDDKFRDLAALHGSSGVTRLADRLNFTHPFSASEAYEMFLSGLLSVDEADAHGRASGTVRAKDLFAAYMRAYAGKLPGADEILRLARLGIVSHARAVEWLKLTGLADDEIRSVVERSTATLPHSVVFDLLNRGDLSHERAMEHLRSSGIVHERDFEAVNRLRFANLPVQSIVQTFLRAQTALRFPRLFSGDRDVPTAVAEAGERNGWDRKTIHLADAPPPHSRVSPVELEWHSHWVRPNASDALEAHFRLTPERCRELRASGIEVEPLSDEEINSLIEKDGVAPEFIPYAKALRHSVVPLRMLHQQYTAGIITRDEMVHLIQQTGIIRADAERLVKSWDALQEQKSLAPVQQLLNSQLKDAIKLTQEAYSTGYIDQPTAVNQLVNYGVPFVAATQACVLADATRQHSQVQAGIKLVQNDFEHGGINATGAVAALNTLGLVPERSADYVSQWQIERQLHQQHASTGKVLDWLKHGTISAQNALMRLENIGWAAPDARIMVTEAEGEVKKLAARALTAEQKTRAARAAEMQKIVQDAEKNLKAYRAALRADTSVSTLQRWFKKGVIGARYFQERIIAMGHTPEEAKAWLNDAFFATPTGEAVTNGHVFPQDEATNVDLGDPTNPPPGYQPPYEG